MKRGVILREAFCPGSSDSSRAGTGHTAERGIHPRINREEHPQWAEMFIELLTGDARLQLLSLREETPRKKG